MSDCGDVKKVFVPVQSNATQTIPPELIKGVLIEDVAAEKIKLFLQNEQKSPDEYGLKVTVKKDGCSGKSYDMQLAPLAPAKEAGDKIFEKNGAYFIVDKLSYMFVAGSILSYTEALTGSGFALNNPNVKKTCSCGSSFAV